MIRRFDCGERPCPDNPQDPACTGHRVTAGLRRTADIIVWTEQRETLTDLHEPLQTYYVRLALDYERDRP